MTGNVHRCLDLGFLIRFTGERERDKHCVLGDECAQLACQHDSQQVKVAGEKWGE